MPSKVCNREITYPFPNFNARGVDIAVRLFSDCEIKICLNQLQRCNRWSLGMDNLFHPTLYNGCNYLSKLGLMLIHVSKRGFWTPAALSATYVALWCSNYIIFELQGTMLPTYSDGSQLMTSQRPLRTKCLVRSTFSENLKTEIHHYACIKFVLDSFSGTLFHKTGHCFIFQFGRKISKAWILIHGRLAKPIKRIASVITLWACFWQI